MDAVRPDAVGVLVALDEAEPGEQVPRLELRTSNRAWNKGWFYPKDHP